MCGSRGIDYAATRDLIAFVRHAPIDNVGEAGASSRMKIIAIGISPAHKSVAIRAAIEGRGTTLHYLPPYSPDLNPIENAFSKLKSILRKIAARTLEGLWDAILQALATVEPTECTNYFAAASYGSA